MIEAATPMLAADDPFGEAFQRALARWNGERLEPGFPDDQADAMFDRDAEMRRCEGGFIERLRAEVAEAAADAPGDPNGFVAWFEALACDGPGQDDPLLPWLASHATREQISWFMAQEAAGEAGFDDLVAYTQVKLPIRAKLELARNYWDEMGRGNPRGMHGPMFDLVVETLGALSAIETTVAESLTLANAMTALATSRRYAWQAVGALGVNELISAQRSRLTAQALRRVGLSDRQRRYFDLHAVLEVKHSADWNREVVIPLIAEDPHRAMAIAEGALIRLTCGARCFARYREILWAEAGPYSATSAMLSL